MIAGRTVVVCVFRDIGELVELKRRLAESQALLTPGRHDPKADAQLRMSSQV
jgi:hypothetical protein